MEEPLCYCKKLLLHKRGVGINEFNLLEMIVELLAN